MKFEDWAEKGMEREGSTPEEYCNAHGYNWEDITDNSDENDSDE